jgi:hypothetical protein
MNTTPLLKAAENLTEKGEIQEARYTLLECLQRELNPNEIQKIIEISNIIIALQLIEQTPKEKQKKLEKAKTLIEETTHKKQNEQINDLEKLLSQGLL